jgi:hypothetical protein
MNEQRGTWLSLVTYCAVTALTAALGFAALFAGATVAFAVAQSVQVSAERQPEVAASPSNSGKRVPIGEQQEAAVLEPMSHASQIRESSTAPVRTFAGMITDSRCGARHPMDSGKTSAECVRSCARNGSVYVLVDGEVIHALEGNPTQLEKLAGERVEIVGMLDGDTIKVKSVAAR